MTNALCCNVPTTRKSAQSRARIGQDAIAGVYDKKAWMYDAWAALTESGPRNRAIALAQIEDGQSLLEVAVGTGLTFRELLKRNPSGYTQGIDLSPGMLKKAQRKAASFDPSHYRLEEGSALHLPVADESVDTLVSNYMFDLMSDDDMVTVVQEFMRVIKPGGQLILVNMTRGERWGSGIYEKIYTLSPATMGGCRGVRMSPILEDQGLVVERREYHQQAFFPSEVIRAFKKR